ncbi:titin isoform X2 [Mycetomoellerius zeteki]|uniref:titin isoform X2 n=1 Tax=Mycetomoellerius zeteki TaxID=64791 RepID=UPI00084ECF6B|nr:PREDICTED: titin isoform X2 [Trachymyrmex zeteki]
MSALNAALCRSGIILWLAVVLLLASRSTHSAPVYDQDTTQIAEYDGTIPGCYFNYQRYQEGDRIMTSEPCLNCTCHNRMLMCYLKVCPFTKAIGQDCTVEKRPDQCCPVITCPEVPVQLLTSTTSAPDSTEVGFHDNYGCHVDERFYADGAMLPLDHHNPCELCYCIRNRTTCVMQECTLQVAGCKPVYQPGVCCPIKYNCEYDEESSTTVGPTPGLIMTTTLPPGMLPQCYYEGKVYEDGDLIYSTQPCQHCYCFRGEIACAVQNCGTPMQEHGKNCTALPPPEGECCPTIYECEGVTTVRDQGEEQFSEQVHNDQMTESPILIDQEDQQMKGEHPQEEVFPGIDNNIPYAQEEEDKTVQGTIEHITQGHIPSTEKPEEEIATLPTEKIETTTAEKEVTPSHEHVTETSPEVTSEKAEEVPSEIEATKPEAPTTVQGTEESLVTEAPATELPKVSSIAEGLQPEEELLTTEHVSKEHVSTEENIIEEEPSTSAVTERGQSIEPSINETTQTEGPIKEEETTSPHEELSTQTEGLIKEEETTSPHEELSTQTEGPIKEEETTSPHEELSTQTQEEITQKEVTQEEITQEGQISSEKPESSTEAIEKTTSPIEEPSISTVSEFVSEQPKASEGESETMPGVLLATETESPKEEETVTPAHEVFSTEQITTEREEMSHPTEIAVTEQSTEISGLPKEQPAEEQKPVISEKEQQPEETTSEHAIIEEQATAGAKKEDAGLTESSVISEEPLITEVSHAEEESTPEIPAQGPTGIPIPERSPEQKAEDESVYHVTEDYHGFTHPEISPDNLITEVPQKIPVTHLPQEQETTLAPSEEIAKPIATEGIEVSMEGTMKPIEEATEINLPIERKPEITTVSEETQSTPAVTEVQISTESSTAVISQRIPEEEAPEKSIVPEETVSEVPQTEIQLTEKSPSSEEMPTKELEESSESSSGEVSGEKEVQPKKEEEIETQPPIVTEPEIAPEISTTLSAEHSTVPSDLKKEHTTEGEYVTTVISSAEQSTHAPQVEEKETEIIPIEKEEPITEKPVEEHVTEHPITTPGITGEEEKELQTEEPILKEEQTTEVIKTTETEEERTRVPAIEEGITEQPEQYSTKKALEEAAVTESHGLEETESTKGVTTESAEQQAATVTEKESTEETVELKPTEITGVEQTELPVEHPTEAGKIEKEGEEKISVPVSTEGIQTEIPEVETETTTELEKKQTETSVSGISSQPPIPSDRKEDQEPIEPELNEEQLTQKPEKEITETYEEPQKPTVLPEEEISHIPSSEGTITESVLPEEKLAEGSTTESVTVTEAITPEQPEISSEQPEEVTTELSGQEEQTQEEQTQEPITEKQPEIHEKTEIETSSPATHEESSTPEVPRESVEDVGVSNTTETAESEGTSIPVLISEASTELPGLEEFTKHEVLAEEEVTPATESVPSEKEQPEIQEQVTQPSLKEETPIKEKGETESPAEISTEEGIISETPKVSITEQPLKSEEEEKMITEMPEHEEKETYSTIVPKETTQYTTSIPEEISVEEESTTELVPRPSGIPGEGNCLVEGQSYNNNSAVPPANACQTSCRCISSIVQCELVQCPAPPAHLSNCMPVHTNGESCCPMYACDSTPTAELESDSHVIEPHVSGEKEIQTTVSPTEIPKEATTESSTLVGEISTPKSPVEITVPSITSEEEIVTEKQQTTLKPIETVYEQPTTARQPIEQYPEEHTISSVPETSQESSSQISEEHTVSPIIPGETTESKISEEGITESVGLTEQPQKETGEKQIPISDETITSTQVPAEQESHSTEEPVTVPSLTKETSVPVEVEESSIPVEKGQEVTTIAASKDEGTSIPTTEQEKPTEEEGIEEQSTFKPIEKEQPEEEKVSLKPISEEPVTVEEQETSTKSKEILTEKPGIQEEQSTSVSEIQSTTEHKPESETEKEKEYETVTSTETVQTEEPESQTKLPGIAPSEIETQEPITSTAESTTLIHDHTVSEETSTKEYTTIKSVEISTEESTQMEPKISTQAPATEEEHVTVAILPVETETPIEGTTKLVEESTPEVSHEKTTESAIEKETTEYPEKQTEPSIIEHEEELSATKLPEEKPSETESSVISEEPAKTEPTETEYEKPTETSIAQEPGSTQISVEEHPETTPEIESHTPELPAEEHTEEISTTSASTEEKTGEQPTTPIVKETEPSLSEEGTKQPVISESETPVAEEEHVTVPIIEQTSKSEYPIEEQTVTSPSEEKITEGASTEVIPVTSQEEQITEKTIESVKPETQLPDTAEEHTVVPEIYKKDEEQKPEIGITVEPGKEEPTTVPELTGADEKETEEAVKEEAVTSGTTEEYTKQEEIEPVVKIHETTIIPKEQKPEEEGQVTEANLLDHPVSEEATTVTSLAPEEYPIEPVKTEEQSTHEPEYQTTLPTVEVSQPVTEISEVEKLPPEEETATAESTEKPEEPVTKLEMSSTEKSEEIPFETEKPEEEGQVTEVNLPDQPVSEEATTVISLAPEEYPIEPEQETEPPEQGETTTKAIESAVTKEILPEEAVSVEVTPKVEEKPTEASTAGEEEEVHPTQSTETTSVHKEEQPSITEFEPTERPLPSEEGTPAGEIQPSQPEESEEVHPTVSEEGHPGMTEEPQFTTEHVPEAPITTKTEEHPEVEEPGTIATEGLVKVSSVKPTELPEEITTVGPEVVPEEVSESQIPIKEESPEPETPVEEPVIKTQPIPTELPIGEITEEIPEEEPIHPQEGEEQTHIDHFPEATVKPETDYGFHEQRPATTPHIPEYPDQSGISGEDNSQFPIPGGYPNPDDDYGEDDYGGPGTCRYGGKVYVSAQQIPRDDPCDFCFCFRSDIICLQQSCPPPIPGCHEEPISGFCCPRYECPVSMATALNLTTTTTTTTTTLPPHFPAHAYKGAARRSGCQLNGHAYRVGEVIKSASNPCLRCICGNDGKMKCDPQVCSPEPMLRQMIAATTEAKRRR